MKTKKKKILDFNKKLNRYRKNKDYVRISRKGANGEENIYGFILEMNENFLLLQIVEDFKLNGYVIIKMNRFDSIQCSPTQEFQKHIMKKENELQNLQNPSKLNLTSMNEILLSLKEKKIFVIMECEDLKNPTFGIGKISTVKNKIVKYKYVTSSGTLEKLSSSIRLKDLTIIRFEDNYSVMYNKYHKKEKH